jgi:hypothetical protein
MIGVLDRLAAAGHQRVEATFGLVAGGWLISLSSGDAFGPCPKLSTALAGVNFLRALEGDGGFAAPRRAAPRR